MLIQPQSYNILPNGHAITTCKGQGTHSVIQFIEPSSLGQLSESHSFEVANPYGIYLTVDPQGDNTITWTINITGLSNTDKVEFYCKFLNNQFYLSNTAKINVINGMLL